MLPIVGNAGSPEDSLGPSDTLFTESGAVVTPPLPGVSSLLKGQKLYWVPGHRMGHGPAQLLMLLVSVPNRHPPAPAWRPFLGDTSSGRCQALERGSGGPMPWGCLRARPGAGPLPGRPPPR